MNAVAWRRLASIAAALIGGAGGLAVLRSASSSASPSPQQQKRSTVYAAASVAVPTATATASTPTSPSPSPSPLPSPTSVLRVRTSHAALGVQGRRPSMEDAHAACVSSSGRFSVFCVFDGHAGPACAQMLARQLPGRLCAELEHDAAAASASPSGTGGGSSSSSSSSSSGGGGSADDAWRAAVLRRVFAQCDSDWLDVARQFGRQDGSTAIVAVVDHECARLSVACTGDSRAVLCRRGRALALSRDHKPELEAERKRVEAAGGWVAAEREGLFVGPARVWPGGLAMSRAFGDLGMKQPRPLVIVDPDVESAALEPGDQFLVLACDGLWDVVSNDEAVGLVVGAGLGERPAEASRALVRHAYASGSTDNITVMLVSLHVDARSRL